MSFHGIQRLRIQWRNIFLRVLWRHNNNHNKSLMLPFILIIIILYNYKIFKHLTKNNEWNNEQNFKWEYLLSLLLKTYMWSVYWVIGGEKCQKNGDTLLDMCVSSLRRGHANLLCIVPILADDPSEEGSNIKGTPTLIKGPNTSNTTLIMGQI